CSFTATCCSCGARMRCSRRRTAAACMARCSDPRPSCCVSWARTAMTACWSSIWAPACRCCRWPSRCWRRLQAAAGSCCGTAKTRAITATAWPNPTASTAGTCPPMRSPCFHPAPKRRTPMAEAILNTMPWPGNAEQPERLLTREWLVTNGLGGYASGSIAGVCTRRYHGLLVAALPTPIGRTVMLSHLGEWLQLPDKHVVRLTGEERPDAPYDLPEILTEFRLEMGLPVWRYRVRDIVVEKRILLPYGQNTVHVNYR